MSQQHGSYDAQQQKWFCSYWMTLDEWYDIHDYAPSHSQQKLPEDDAANDNNDNDDDVVQEVK